MSLFQHYTQFQHRLNASKHPQHDGDLDDMSFFAQSACPLPLESPTPNTRLQTSRGEMDDYLTSDLDASFTSTMSIQSPEPPHATLVPEDTSVDLMDISPLPPSQSQWDEFSVPKSSRSRAFTTATGRTFGNDMSNSPPKKDTTSQMRRTQRGTLPSEWMTSARIHEPASKTAFEPLTVLYSRQPPQELPLLDSDDAMDIDTSFVAVEKLLIPGGTSPPLSPSPSPPPLALSAAPTVTQLNTLFYGTESPIHSPAASPESRSQARVQPFPEPEPTPRSSSPVLHSSPSVRKLERIRSGPMPPRIGKPSLLNMGKANVPRKAHRPTLSATIPPSDYQSLRSACPSMASRQSTDMEASGLLPPARRAVSAMFPPPGYPNLPSDDLFDSPNNSSPAQAHAIRQQFKPKRKSNGADELRHLKGVTPMMQRNTPPGSSARFASSGLPGFGDNEAHGKILPCHRVTEDGLMRITAKTLDSLLDGHFNSRIAKFHVLDCRFDYEYNGGHIPGAVNINTTAAVETLLLEDSDIKPRPSTSGDSMKKTVLVFHCEFSAKRAPTFAKHLRAKDRALNNHVYPKIHYPELYILEGGYCEYFKQSGARCHPPAYVSMDDPNHTASRRADLDQFRKARFGRTKSYTYGDHGTKLSTFTLGEASKRNTAPDGGSNYLLAAADAARTRRGGLGTLHEDGNTTQEEDDMDFNPSPCPAASKQGSRGRKAHRPLARAETYGPTKLFF